MYLHEKWVKIRTPTYTIVFPVEDAKIVYETCKPQLLIIRLKFFIPLNKIYLPYTCDRLTAWQEATLKLV